MSKRFLFIDTETSGLSPASEGVCEIAWIETDEDLNVIDQYSSLIDPEVPIKPGAQSVHGISDEMVEDAPTLEELVTVVFEDNPFLRDNLVFVAHNAPFDWGFLKDVFNPETDLMDTLVLARRLYPDADNHKLPTLAIMFGLESFNHKDAHGALADVKVLKEFVEFLVQDTGMSLYDLLEYSNAFIPVEICKYKKHEGKLWKDVVAEDRQYVDWVLSKDWCKGDLRKTLNMLLETA